MILSPLISKMWSSVIGLPGKLPDTLPVRRPFRPVLSSQAVPPSDGTFCPVSIRHALIAVTPCDRLALVAHDGVGCETLIHADVS